MNIGYKEGMVTYDAAFYGSDTIWNVWKQNDLHQGFDSVFGEMKKFVLNINSHMHQVWVMLSTLKILFALSEVSKELC